MIAPRAFRATEIAKEFSKRGHNVTVPTHKGNNDYSEFERKYNLKVKDFVKGRWKDIHTNSILFKTVRFILNYEVV